MSKVLEVSSDNFVNWDQVKSDKKNSLYTVGGNVNWYSHHGEQYGDSLKN